MSEQIVPAGAQSPSDIAQNARNAQNPALIAARAAIADLVAPGERMGWSAAWRREWSAAYDVWFQAVHDAGDHRLCWPHACDVAAGRAERTALEPVAPAPPGTMPQPTTMPLFSWPAPPSTRATRNTVWADVGATPTGNALYEARLERLYLVSELVGVTGVPVEDVHAVETGRTHDDALATWLLHVVEQNAGQGR